MCAALCFTPTRNLGSELLWCHETWHEFFFFFLPFKPHSSHKSTKPYFWQSFTFSWPHSTFRKSQQTRDSVFALVRLIAGVTEFPRDPSRGPWTCERVRTWARWVTARLLIPAWASCTLRVIDHYKSFYIMEISRGERSEGLVQGKDSNINSWGSNFRCNSYSCSDPRM